MSTDYVLIALAAYVLVGRWLTGLRWSGRKASFCLLNLLLVYLIFFYRQDRRFTELFSLLFAVYLAIVSLQYLALVWWGQRAGWLPWLAFLVPIAVLVAIRFAPVAELARLASPELRGVLARHPEFKLAAVFVGLSYLAFRTSHLVMEVRNRVVPLPSLAEYLGFAFFVPTLAVGPINPYSQYRQAFAESGRPDIPLGRALMRILVGAVKYRFLAPLLNQFTYSGLLMDGHPHLWMDLPIAAVAYYLYLYCNFSGFCDMAIGVAGLMGISVAENFQSPFSARNIKEFWNRWHITLSQYMRDMVFSPLSKLLVRAMGPARAQHAIALTIVVVFLLIGVWHGIGWNYAAFGALHAIGVVTNHYFGLGLRTWLGKETLGAYNKSHLIHAAAVAMTFVFVTASLFLFANDLESMRDIISRLQTRGTAQHEFAAAFFLH